MTARSLPISRMLLGAVLALLTLPAWAGAPVEPLEAGDPGWAHCKSKGILDRCFKLKLEGGNVATIAESDFTLPAKTQLALTERSSPFTVKVDTFTFTVEVPKPYIWAVIPLKTQSGDDLLLSVYSDRKLARKALAIWQRIQEEQEKLHEKARKSKRKDIDLLDDPFFAEHADLGAGSGDEIVVYGGSGFDNGADNWSFVLDSKANDVLITRERSFPALQVVTVDTGKDGATPRAYLADGIAGCDAPGSMRLWRLDEDGKQKITLDVDMIDDMLGIPEAWFRRATKKRYIELWVKPQIEGRALTGIELYDDDAKCSNGSEGYRIFWRNGTPRGKKI